MKDELGERMKSQYEDRTRFFVPRRTFTIIRLDGKAFHTYTRGLEKPFDQGLSKDIDEAIKSLLPHIQGSVFAYTQSDEISVLVTDFALPTTSAWFDGNVQKMASVSSSIMTAEFNRLRWARMIADSGLKMELDDPCCSMDEGNFKSSAQSKIAYFDARVFTIPDRTEVMNYFIWRNQDASRNSVSMVAQSKFSHKELQGVSTTGMKDKLQSAGSPWDSYSPADRYGRVIVKETYVTTPPVFVAGPDKEVPLVERSRWVSKPAWNFVEVKEALLNMVPSYDR